MNAKRRKERGSKVRLRHPMYFPEEKSPWPSARAAPQNKMVLQKGWNWGFWPQTMPVKQQNGPPTSSYHTTTNPSPSNHVISTVEKFRAALIYATIAAQAPNADGRALERFQAPKPAVLLGLNKEPLSSARPGSCLHVAAASPAVARGALTELEGWPVPPSASPPALTLSLLFPRTYQLWKTPSYLNFMCSSYRAGFSHSNKPRDCSHHSKHRCKGRDGRLRRKEKVRPTPQQRSVVLGESTV